MKVAIIGCTHAGIAAIRKCLKYYPDVDITVYERHADISYLSCATYLHIGGSIKNLNDVFYADPKEFSDQGVNMKMQYDVITIDAKKHTILSQDLKTKKISKQHYDKLIVATGSITTIPIIPGIENSKIMLCKTCDQAHQLYDASKKAQYIAIIGGGYAGVELAEGFIKSGHKVILFQRNKQLLNDYVDPIMAKKIKQLMEQNNVKVFTNIIIQQFKNIDNKQVKIITNQENYVVDLVAICPGVIPQSDLLKGQVKTAKNGAIVTNPYMETSDPDIFAAGDVTEIHYNPTLSSKYIPLASHAIRQGALAGMNLFKRRLKSIGTQATTGMLLFNHTVACTGLTYKAAKEENFDAQRVFYEGNYRPDFMPSTSKINIELIYDRKSRRVLGAQLMSTHEVAQSANTISVIIQNGNTIDDLSYMDMLFSPNFDEPFNYLNLVAQLAVDKEFNFGNSSNKHQIKNEKS